MGEKNLRFTTRNPTTAPGIGDRLNSANRKSLVFDGGKKPEWLGLNVDNDARDSMRGVGGKRERKREREDRTGVAKRSFTLFSVTFGVLLAFQKGRGQRRSSGRFYGAGEAARRLLAARKWQKRWP